MVALLKSAIAQRKWVPWEPRSKSGCSWQTAKPGSWLVPQTRQWPPSLRIHGSSTADPGFCNGHRTSLTSCNSRGLWGMRRDSLRGPSRRDLSPCQTWCFCLVFVLSDEWYHRENLMLQSICSILELHFKSVPLRKWEMLETEGQGAFFKCVHLSAALLLIDAFSPHTKTVSSKKPETSPTWSFYSVSWPAMHWQHIKRLWSTDRKRRLQL